MATVAELIARLGTGTDTERNAIARELAGYGEQAAVAMVAALPESDVETRWDLLDALAQTPGDTAEQALAAVVRDDPEEGLRAAAAQALGERRTGSGALITALEDESTFVAMQAAHALTRMGPEVVPDLIKLLQEGGPRARLAAARALATIQALEAIPALIAAFEDDSPAVQFYVEQALERMGVGTVLLKPGG